jgi:hypothetical protein
MREQARTVLMNLNQLLSLLVLRPEHGYTVRVDHLTGDHEFWTLRRQFRGAATMARRFRAQYTGLGDTFTIVEISRADLDLHSRYGYECTSPQCPSAHANDVGRM